MKSALLPVTIMIAVATVLCGASTYSRSTEFRAIRLSHADLVRLLAKARSLAERANASAKEGSTSRRERLVVESGGTRLEYRDEIDVKRLERAPAVAYSARYSYEMQVDAPVSGISLELNDVWRKLEVEGNDPDQVDAAFAALTAELNEFATVWGGKAFRNGAGFSLFGIAAMLSILSLTPLVRSDRAKITLSAVFLGVVVSIWLLPWVKWFPGFALYSESASFLTRNSPQMTFVGVLLGALGLGYSIYSRFRRSPPSKKARAREPKTGDKAKPTL